MNGDFSFCLPQNHYPHGSPLLKKKVFTFLQLKIYTTICMLKVKTFSIINEVG